MKLVAQIRSID